jgi:hypothetical protein
MIRRISYIILAALLLASCTRLTSVSRRTTSEPAVPAQNPIPSSPFSLEEDNAPATAFAAPLPVDTPSRDIFPQQESLTAQANASPTPQPPAVSSIQVQSGATRFIVQSGTPTGIPDFIHTNTPCGWSGVGGQVFDRNGLPIIGLLVEVSGILGGNRVGELALTGGATILGPGGYEVKLADGPIASQKTLSLRVLDLSGKPVSDPIPFDTYAECERNLVLINLVEVPAIVFSYLPFLPQTLTKHLFFPLFAQRAGPGQ